MTQKTWLVKFKPHPQTNGEVWSLVVLGNSLHDVLRVLGQERANKMHPEWMDADRIRSIELRDDVVC